jgi:peptidyl-prolyl cis-trans isomerase C
MRNTLLRGAAGALIVACAAAATPAFASEGEDPVVVRRGSAELRMSEIDARLDEVPSDRRAGLMDSPERIDAMLNQLLLLEQLANEAVAEGLEKDPRLQRQLDLVRNRLLAQFRLEQLREKAAKGTDFELLARERYLANRSNFAVPETRTIRHVLVSTGGRSEAEARTAIDAVTARLAAGEALADVARTSSDDRGTRDAGGLIADIPPGTTDPEFERAMNALAAPGDRTPQPVRSSYGWHVIELVSINPGRQKPFEEVRDEILAELRNAAVEKQVRAYTDQLNSLPLDADPALVASLRSRYKPEGEQPVEAAKSPAPAAAPQPPTP